MHRVLSPLAEKSPVWKSVSNAKIRLGLKDGEGGQTTLYLFGYTAEELEEAKLPFSECPGLKNVASIRRPDDILSAHLKKRVIRREDGSTSTLEVVETGGRWFYPKNWDKDFPDGSELRLVDNSGVPLFVIDYQLWKEAPIAKLRELLKDEAAVLAIQLHELFHAYQAHFSSHYLFEVDWNKDCLSNKNWSQSLATELEDWKILFELPAGEEARVRRLLDRRMNAMNNDEMAKQCWRNFETVETQEGTAVYFSRGSLESLGRKDPVDLRMLWTNTTLSIDNESIFSNGSEIFYLTGAHLSKLLERIDPKAGWQTEIEKGDTLAKALRARLAK